MATAEFNKIFKDANENTQRYRVMLGSAGSGKSVNLAQDYILKLSQAKYKGCSLLVVRGVEVSHLHSTYAELCSAIDRLGVSAIWERRLSPLGLKCTVTGNQIIFRGCNDQRAIERLKSVTVPQGSICWAWLEEATELKQSDMEIIDDRLRGVLPDNLYYQVTLSFNPIHSGHWIKKILWDYKDKNTFTHKSTYLDNRFIDTAYKERMLRRKEIDPCGYEVYGLGNWGEVGGLVLTAVQIDDYTGVEFDRYTMGADWGFNHFSAVLLIGWRDGSPYVIKEVAARFKTTAELIELCKAADLPRNVYMYCDSAEPDRVKQFQQAGYKAIPVHKEKNVTSNQITFLKNRVIYIDGRCNQLVKEIQAYKWQKDPLSGEYTDKPVEFDDDCIKALMYGCEPVRKAQRLQTMNKGVLSV